MRKRQKRWGLSSYNGLIKPNFNENKGGFLFTEYAGTA
jgi:hypothetical protein